MKKISNFGPGFGFLVSYEVSKAIYSKWCSFLRLKVGVHLKAVFWSILS